MAVEPAPAGLGVSGPQGKDTDFVYSFSGTLNIIQNNLIPLLTKVKNVTVNRLEAYVVTAPTGQDAIFELMVNGAPTGDTVTITAGATSGAADIAAVAITGGDTVSFRINQVGSGQPGVTATMIARIP